MSATQELRDLLRKRYPAPEWAFMEEVAPATGGGTRYADAIAVNLWASRGHAIHGFEVKSHRGDWLRELKSPEKAEPVYRYCNHWWIVAAKDIVKDGELPPTWGLIEVRGNTLAQKVGAPALTPQPISLEFFASLMRRAHEQIDKISELKTRRAIAEAREEIDRRVEREIADRSKLMERQQKSIEEFTAATGLSFNHYSGPPIRIIKLAQKLERLCGWRDKEAGQFGELLDVAEQLSRAAGTVREAVASIDAASEQPAPAVAA